MDINLLIRKSKLSTVYQYCHNIGIGTEITFDELKDAMQAKDDKELIKILISCTAENVIKVSIYIC